MTRKAKTPKQRAEEQLAAAERRLKRADDLVNRLTREMHAAGIEQDNAKARRDYAAKDPALATQSTGNTGTTGATATPRTSTTGGTTR